MPDERYQSFLLRLWPDEDQGRVTWRMSIQSIPDGERKGFTDLIDLLTYLEATTVDPSTTENLENGDQDA